MSCQEILLPDAGGAAIICRKGERRCTLCSRVAEFQCDFPIGGEYTRGRRKGEKRTCDKYLCRDHAMHGKTEGVDFCPGHYHLAKAAHDRRQQFQKYNPDAKVQHGFGRPGDFKLRYGK